MNLNIRSRKRPWFVFVITLIAFIFASLFINVTVYTRVEVMGLTISGGTIYLLIILTMLAILIGVFSREFYISWLLKQRQKKLMRSSYELRMRRAYIPLSEMLQDISENKRKFRKQRIENSYIGDGWGYGEYVFTRYGETKHGTYDVADYHYAVAVFRLPRKLPNVLFDSKATGGREFKALLDDSQRHSLESIFDNYFDTYFHNDYTIDNLSFITPEVMEAIIEAKEYDVEIYRDYVYLYNELEDMPAQLIDMQRKGFAIVNKLLNNIYSYRDERIPYVDGRRTVSIRGLRLQKSLTFDYIAVGVAAAFLTATVIFGLYNLEYGAALAQIALVLTGVMLPRLERIQKIRREKRFAEANQGVGAI